MQMQNTVDLKRIVTLLTLFQLSEGQSRSSNGSHKVLKYSGTPLMRPPLGYEIVVVKMRRSHSRVIFKKIKIKISLISTFEFREYGRNNEVII